MQLDHGSKRLWIVLGGISLVGLLAIDKYSYGYGGGEEYLRSHMWQALLTAILATLLLVWSVAALLSNWRVTRSIVLTEASLFALVNLFYVYRDGFGRFFWGYAHAATGLIVVLAGLLIRWKVYRWAANPPAEALRP